MSSLRRRFRGLVTVRLHHGVAPVGVEAASSVRSRWSCTIAIRSLGLIAPGSSYRSSESIRAPTVTPCWTIASVCQAKAQLLHTPSRRRRRRSVVLSTRSRWSLAGRVDCDSSKRPGVHCFRDPDRASSNPCLPRCRYTTTSTSSDSPSVFHSDTPSLASYLPSRCPAMRCHPSSTCFRPRGDRVRHATVSRRAPQPPARAPRLCSLCSHHLVPRRLVQPSSHGADDNQGRVSRCSWSSPHYAVLRDRFRYKVAALLHRRARQSR